MRLVVGITGSTGVVYGVRILEVLKGCKVETHLVITEWAKKCLAMETSYNLDDVKNLASTYSDDSNLAAGISSGTHKTDGMVVIPCSMKTLSSIANGYDETLVARAAGVTLKNQES
jgi:4-hydroxy-3-polyprenylbenzoate decarboxylase